MQNGYKTALGLVSLLAMITAGCAQHSARVAEPEAPPAAEPAQSQGGSEAAEAATPAVGETAASIPDATATTAPTTAAADAAAAGAAPTAPAAADANTPATAEAAATSASAAPPADAAATSSNAPAAAETSAPAAANASPPADGNAVASAAPAPDAAAERQKKELAAKLLAIPPQDISKTISLMAKHPRVRWLSKSGQYAYYVGGEFNAEYNPGKKLFTISSDPGQANPVSCEYGANGQLVNGKNQDMKAECNEMASQAKPAIPTTLPITRPSVTPRVMGWASMPRKSPSSIVIPAFASAKIGITMSATGMWNACSRRCKGVDTAYTALSSVCTIEPCSAFARMAMPG